jgi:hypothetical protein
MALTSYPAAQWPESGAAAVVISTVRIIENDSGVLVWTTDAGTATHAFDDDGVNTLTLEPVADVASAARLRHRGSTILHQGSA